MFDRSAGVTWEAALELLSWKEEGGWATAKAPAVSRMANPFEISCNQRFTALNPIPAPSACYESDRKSVRPYGTVCGLTSGGGAFGRTGKPRSSISFMACEMGMWTAPLWSMNGWSGFRVFFSE